MSDLLDEAHEFLLCMDKMEYADALFALRAELTEARRQLKEASEQEPMVCVAVSVAVEAAHIAAKGQYQAVVHHLNRYAHQSYTRATVTAQPAVPEAVAKDAARYRLLQRILFEDTNGRINAYDFPLADGSVFADRLSKTLDAILSATDSEVKNGLR